MFLSLLCECDGDGQRHLPGGASGNDPVPQTLVLRHWWTYMLIAFVVFTAAVFAVTRLNVDR